jgi:succinate dehydrogenase / fumarate reductase, cytochrome b subunit
MPPVVQSACRFCRSSIGKKILVALTGAVMVAFVTGHLLGNLLVFGGPDALNSYAKKLKDMGPLLWVARLGLLTAVAVHIVLTIQLTAENKLARRQAYGVDATQKATRSSRTMIWSGLTILAFLLYHLAHYTWGVANQYYQPGHPRYSLPDGSHNVYNMVVDGFSWAPASLFYIVAMGLLFMHLGHGIASMFQTLGLSSAKARPVLEKASKGFALLLFAGNALMPLSILCGWVK